MTSLPPEPAEIPSRSPAATWGAAHLAWGLVIFLALLYAAQQWPVNTTSVLATAAALLNIVGLAWMTLSGWRHIQQGWNLRCPAPACGRENAGQWLTDLVLAALLTAVLLRGAQSRTHVAGLDRLAAAVITIASLSLLLALLECVFLRAAIPPAAASRLDRVRLLVAVAFAALIVTVELLPL
jgi:hypothetical protein